MKLTLRLTLLLTIIFACSGNSFSQISFQSTKGYSVNIYVAPVKLVIYGNDNKCTWGYNYDVELEYVVTFTGKNAPKNLWTLQGTINNKNSQLFFSLPKNQKSGTVRTNGHAWRGVADCATATISTMEFKDISIAISGDGIDYQVVTFAYSVVLPVNMVSFSAVDAQQKIKLNWQTASETNNEFFTIERSTNQNQWVELKKVKGAGTSTDLHNYETYDESPVSGTSYYRIKQTDFNGNTSYSEIRSVRYESKNKGLSVFPVPNTGNTITINGISNFRNHELQVVNSAGARVYANSLTNATVELPSLVKGVYFLRITDKMSGETSTIRYVKL